MVVQCSTCCNTLTCCSCCGQNAGWSTEAAIDNFYTSPELPAPSGRRKAIEALFDRLKDPQQDIILVDGITQFCNELEVHTPASASATLTDFLIWSAI